MLRKPKTLSRILFTMDIFNKSTVQIKDRDRVEGIISQLIKGGASQLQVISDFDHTISRVHKNGEKCSSTYSVIEESPYSSEDYKTKVLNLFNKYHPIEVDPNLSKAEKVPYMVEWYLQSVDLMPSSGLTEECLPEIVALSNACLRDGCDVIFESLYKHNVPLLVFSAGVGDVLKEILKKNNLLYPNVKIIANFLHFDEKNKLSGFKGELIHTFNKNQSSIQNDEYFHQLKMRDNIILLGDSLGDLDMAEGVEHINAILKIGFLNYKIEENLPKYLNAYDIVLTDDQTMDVVVGLLQSIL